MNTNPDSPQLRREVGLWGAILLGLGSMIGTGVFVSIGIGAGITGASVILAVMIGAGVAICNGLSSAQLAANHPVAGGFTGKTVQIKKGYKCIFCTFVPLDQSEIYGSRPSMAKLTC